MALGSVRADLLASGIAQVPQVAFQVDERHGGPLAGGGRAGYGRAKVVDQLADRPFCLLIGRFPANLFQWILIDLRLPNSFPLGTWTVTRPPFQFRWPQAARKPSKALLVL